jgi:DNA repair protein RadC
MDEVMEKMAVYGEENVNELELLTILIGEKSARKLILERLSNKQKPLEKLKKISLRELEKISGMGLRKAAILKAALELGKRMEQKMKCKEIFVRTAREIVLVTESFFAGAEKEKFLAIALDSKHRVIKIFQVSEGSLMSCPVHPREVFRTLIREGAIAAVLAHNHPSSGDPEPSREDIEITRRLAKTGKLLGIPVLDHVIVGEESYVSLVERYSDVFK